MASGAIYREITTSPVFVRSVTGFTLADAATGKTLCDVNGDKYFIPASTAKLFTLYTCLNVLGDSLPAFRYYLQPWTADEEGFAILRPTGDPTFLHPQFDHWQSAFVKMRELGSRSAWMLIDTAGWRETALGPGWAWDDVDHAYSVERSPWPIYGNVKRLRYDYCHDRSIHPAFWEPFFDSDYELAPGTYRQDHQNRLFTAMYGPDPPPGEYVIPVRQAAGWFSRLLADTAAFMIAVDYGGVRADQRFYACPVDTVYRRMMYQSDNFIAEQLLLMCAGEKFDTLRQKPMIQWAKDSLLAGITGLPKWVDGSGLSRYNLATPRSLTAVLFKLWREQPRERLFNLFPHNGQPATTLDWMKSKGNQPWLFAKTGSMSGVQCISGYLVARSGRVLAFSFMNNNFVEPGKPWKEEMERVLWEVRGRY